jgi:glycosyl transferase family 25
MHICHEAQSKRLYQREIADCLRTDNMPVSTMVKIISLANSRRREEFSRAAAEATLPWSFFDGYTKIAEPLRYSPENAARYFGRPLTPGEVGCYTSHFKLWEEFLRSSDDQMVVMEEDVIADWKALERLTREDLDRRAIHILRLFSTHPFPFDLCVNRFLSPHAHLVRVRGLVLGTQAYIVTRRGAEALLNACTDVVRPIDWEMSRYWSYRIPNYCIAPYPVLERYGASAIGQADRERALDKKGSSQVARFLFRLCDRLVRERFNRSYMKSNPFGKTHDSGPAYIDAP